MAKPVVICQQCGKKFEAYLSDRKKYCSRECYWKFKKGKKILHIDYEKLAKSNSERIVSPKTRETISNSLKGHPNWNKKESTKIKRICKICGKEFYVYPSVIKKGNGKYCSKKCKDDSLKNQIKRICPICNKEFSIPPSNNKIFCSKKCRHISNHVIKICQQCGKEFEVTKHTEREDHPRFCSRKCFKDSLKKQIKCTCIKCGKEFTRPPCLVFTKMYCSKECRKSDITERICKQCGKKFKIKVDDLKWKKGLFCSLKCANKYKIGKSIGISTKITKKCEICGKEYKVNPSYLKRTCSKKCNRILRSRLMTGEGNPYYGKKHNKETRRKLRIALLRTLKEKKFEGGQLTPMYNSNACKYFSKFDQSNNTNGMYATNGGEYQIKELGYFPDYFNPKLKLIIEWDEERHYKNDQLKKKDIKRQKEIENLFPDYKFERIREKDLIGVSKS